MPVCKLQPQKLCLLPVVCIEAQCLHLNQPECSRVASERRIHCNTWRTCTT